MGSEATTTDDVLEAVEAATEAKPVTTAPELAEELPVGRRTVLNRLRELEAAGDVESHQFSERRVVWWPAGGEERVDDVDEEPPTTEQGAESDIADSGSSTDDESGYDGGAEPSGHSTVDATSTGGNEAAGTAARRDDAAPGEVAFADLGFPGGVNRDAAVAAILAARDYLREHGPASKGEIVAAVMPGRPLGYDVDDALENVNTSGERYRGAWWRKVVSEGLEALPDVEKPPRGKSEWSYRGESKDESERSSGPYDPTGEF